MQSNRRKNTLRLAIKFLALTVCIVHSVCYTAVAMVGRSQDSFLSKLQMSLLLFGHFISSGKKDTTEHFKITILRLHKHKNARIALD